MFREYSCLRYTQRTPRIYFYSTRLIVFPYFRANSRSIEPRQRSRGCVEFISLARSEISSRNGKRGARARSRNEPFRLRIPSRFAKATARARAGPHDWMRRGERSGREKRSKNPRIPRTRGADACGACRSVTHRGSFASIASHRVALHRVTSRKSMPVLYCVSLQRAYMTAAGSLHRYDDQITRRAFVQ